MTKKKAKTKKTTRTTRWTPMRANHARGERIANVKTAERSFADGSSEAAYERCVVRPGDPLDFTVCTHTFKTILVSFGGAYVLRQCTKCRDVIADEVKGCDL